MLILKLVKLLPLSTSARLMRKFKIQNSKLILKPLIVLSMKHLQSKYSLTHSKVESFKDALCKLDLDRAYNKSTYIKPLVQKVQTIEDTQTAMQSQLTFLQISIDSIVSLLICDLDDNAKTREKITKYKCS